MSKLSRIYLSTVITFATAASLIYALFPDFRAVLLSEDLILESLSVLIFLSSVVVSLFFFLKMRRRPHSVVFAIVALIAFVGFIDEIGFGSRILPIPIAVVAGVHVDATHDLILVSAIILKRNFDLLVYGSVFGALALTAVIVLSLYQSKIRTKLRFLVAHGPYTYLSYFILLNVFATVIDVSPIIYAKLGLVAALAEEIFEVSGAISILFASFKPMNTLSGLSDLRNNDYPSL